MYMTRYLDLANIITVFGLLLAYIAVFMVLQGFLHGGFALLVVAGLCDLYDGVIARRLNRNELEHTFGKHLDSLADACSFVFAPTIMLYGIGLNGTMETILLATFLVAGIWRLAFYNTTGLETINHAAYFTGLPVTYSALVLPAIALFLALDGEWAQFALILAVTLLAVLMVSPLKIPKPRGKAYLYLLSTAVIVMALHLYLEFSNE